MSNSDPAPAGGLFNSVRRLLTTAVEMAKVRLDLLSTELELEKHRILNGLFWGALALLFLGVGTVLACGFVVLLLWEGYRLAAVGVLALAFLGGGGLLMQSARKRLGNPGGLFEASVAELARDQTDLGSRP